MARGLFYRSMRWRPPGSKLCYEVSASKRVQVVKRKVLEHAVAIVAAIEITANYGPAPCKRGKR